MANKWNQRRWAVLTAAVLTAGALLLGTLYAQGFWDESRAVHINARTIEPSTLAIGTHLIHLSALSDSVYELAQTSAEESGQDQIYYKSELGGDAWFNISSATSLEDITTGGAPVTDEEIEALYFTYHTKSDKITYDLRTGQAVNLFDIRNPYDLESLDELSPLKMRYDQVRETQGENDATRRIDQIWATPVSGADGPAAVQDWDKRLAALQSYLTVLSEHGADSKEIDQVNTVMEAVDAARRYEVFTVLEPVLSDYLDELGKGKTVSITTGEGDDKTTVDLMENDPELMSAVSESLGNVQDALITYGGKMLTQGETVMSQTEYDFSNDLIAHAESGDHAGCDGDVQNLILLSNIQNDIISDRPRELALLENTLLPKAGSAYQQILGQGESAEYRAEVAKRSAQALLDSLIGENEGQVNTRRGELEFLIEAKCSRIDAASGMDFIDQRLDLTNNSYATVIPDDAFAETSRASVDTHIQFLTQKRRALELASGGNEMDALVAEKEDLQTQRLAALDKNDLAGAKALAEQISAVEEQIRTMEAEAAAQIANARDKVKDLEAQAAADSGNTDLQNQLSAAKAELSNLENSLSDGSLGAMVAQLKQDALSGLSDGDSEGQAAAANAVDALSGLLATDPKLVLPAMQEIYNQLLLSDGDQDMIDAIEQAILDNPNALRDELTAAQLQQIARDYFAENGGGSGTGSGSATGSGSGSGTAGTGSGSTSGSAGSGTGTTPGGSGTDGDSADPNGGTTGSGTDGTGGTNGSGTNSGTGSKTNLLGTGGITLAAAREGAVELAALQLYYDETGSRAAGQRLAAVAQNQKSLGNPMVFSSVRDGSGEYVPLSAVQALTGRRYVWNKNASLGVLARGSDYYGFTVYSTQVQRDRDGKSTETMARAAKYQNGVYIPEEFAFDQFQVQALYLSGTALGCAVDDTALIQAQALFARFLAG